MQDAAPEGKVRRPVPAAWGDPRYVVNTMLAAGIGEWSVLSNYLATPLFALPLIVALFRSGRIGVIGALVITAGIGARSRVVTSTSFVE